MRHEVVFSLILRDDFHICTAQIRGIVYRLYVLDDGIPRSSSPTTSISPDSLSTSSHWNRKLIIKFLRMCVSTFKIFTHCLTCNISRNGWRRLVTLKVLLNGPGVSEVSGTIKIYIENILHLSKHCFKIWSIIFHLFLEFFITYILHTTNIIMFKLLWFL